MSHRSPDKRKQRVPRRRGTLGGRSLSLTEFLLSGWGVATLAVLAFFAAYLIIIFVIY